jgi:ABC-type multidrug transport system ATPase subunit
MHAPLVEVYALERRFGSRAVLSGVDMVVGAGEIHGLLGPARAGRTTLLRILAGQEETTSGRVRVRGRAALVEPSEVDPRIALARAVAAAPDVLLIDAPGFESDTAVAIRALVARHAAGGGAVVWATPRLDDLHGVATAVSLLAGGRVRYHGSVERLAQLALSLPPQPLFRAA